MKIGFLLNHYDIHQVPHVVPYAFALSVLHPEHDVTILCTSRRLESFSRRIGASFPGHRVFHKRLWPPPWIEIGGWFKSEYQLKQKIRTLKWNLPVLKPYEMICTPELTTSRLRKEAGFERTKFVYTCHGAGDNRHGGPFDDRIKTYDLSLLPGRKYASGLTELGFLKPGQYALAGYPKFEVMRKIGGHRRDFFGNGRPVVIYNPHQAEETSSWYRCGEAVLRFFLASTHFNLIFAPHVLLFKKTRPPGELMAELARARHIRIDPASDQSSDMTYVRSADIYLGDQSSQVYEFLETPRPCVFLNPGRIDWRGDPSFLQWTFGRVVEQPGELGPALETALTEHSRFRKAQDAAFAYTFEMPPEGAAVRGAEALHRLATGAALDPSWI